MAHATVGEDDHCVDVVERGVVLGPAAKPDVGFQAGDIRQTFLQQENARVVLMLSGAVAWRAGDEQDLLVGGGEAGGTQDG